MMADKDGELAWFTDQVPTCATDDKLLFINPEFFFKLTMDERIFVLCHEVAHAMFGHAGLHYTIAKQGFIDYTDGDAAPGGRRQDAQLRRGLRHQRSIGGWWDRQDCLRVVCIAPS